MADPITISLIAGACLIGLGVATVAALKAFRAWIDLKRLELASIGGEPGLPAAGGRIELADLKERVRKLEAIAAGIDP
ncbi:hypothetical protein [Sphingomicrobium marinum]|uniref:hypothetical protein n=1 Tax=Sphingomicrobium marinum TaxID=1227950 RepID=UPI00224023E2|nr:hypothetical protein [Sphingomicrobium marinum]